MSRANAIANTNDQPCACAMTVVATFTFEFQRYRQLVEQAIDPLADDEFFRPPGPEVNSIALIVKHLSGNLKSRWSDFLTSDGEKPTRDRDREFVLEAADTRTVLLADWRLAWTTFDDTVRRLTDDDLTRIITIRSEPHTVLEALLRSVNHVAYHAGQIAWLARLFRPDAPWLTIDRVKAPNNIAASLCAIQSALTRYA